MSVVGGQWMQRTRASRQSHDRRLKRYSESEATGIQAKHGCDGGLRKSWEGSERERRHFLSAFPRLIIHPYPHRISLAHRDSRPGGSSPASTLGWMAVRTRSTGLTQRDATPEVSPCIGGRKSGPLLRSVSICWISLSLPPNPGARTAFVGLPGI